MTDPGVSTAASEMRPYKSDPGDRLSKRCEEHLAFSECLTWLAQVVEGKELNVLPKHERVGYGVSGGELLATRAVFRQMLTRFSCIAHPGVASNAPGSWTFFQAVFGNLTGGTARPTLWRGRPRPRPELRLGASFQGTLSLTARRTPASPRALTAGTNRRLHTHAQEGRSDNRPALQFQRRFRAILNRPHPGGAG